MITLEFLSYVQSLDIVLWRDGENIRFSAPPDVFTSSLRDEIRERKAEILPFLPSTAPLSGASQSILPVPRNMVLPLSFAQQRLWFLNQLEPDNPVYNQAFAIRLTGALNVPRLKQSLNAIVARHEVLRTSFATGEDGPTQQIASSLSIPLRTVDLLDTPPAEQKAQVQNIIRTEANAVFDLSKGSLLRATLLHLEEQEYVLLLIVHHIVGDGWSAKIFLRELPAFYEAFEAGKPAHLPSLPIQYADFAVWQREQGQSAALDQQLAYWRERLAGAPTLLELPIDHPRPSMQTYQGAHVQHRLPASMTAALQVISQREHTTLFMSLLTAFAALLARSSGQEDLIIGTPIANRTRSELEDLIGFFANTLPIRVDLGAAPSFTQLLKQVRQRALEAYAHQDVPFERLVEHVQPERTLSHAPLVQVMMVLQQEQEQPLTFSNLHMELLDVEIEVAKFDLTLTVRQQGDELWCNWEYNTQLFERESMVRLGQHFQVLLEGMLSQPEQEIKRLPQLTPRECEQLLEEWNATTVSYPVEGCLHELFAAQVERTPDAIAVVLEEEQLSYAEVNRRANQLAHILRVRGVGPEVLVGICMERSIEMVVGLLAILKAGGAFVPLDPSHPYERLDFILQDTQAAVLLTQQSLVERFSEYRHAVLCLDDNEQGFAQEPTTDPLSAVTSKNLAYVIYTSGSTGQPKGVLIPHNTIARHAILMAEQYQLCAHDRVLQFTALPFDISLEQIFPTLLSGARLILRGSEVWSTTEFHKKVRDFGLTVMNLAPAYWHQLAQEWADAPEHIQDTQLRLVIVGGDKMLLHYVRLWQQTPLRSVRLLNAYGPTETTITSTTFEVPLLSGNEWRMEHVPIGCPTPFRKMYVLDAYGQPVPVGVIGELYIGGDLLARGYLHHPQMTAERFVPDPFSSDPQARMYKTGDLVRYLHDGTLEFWDRADFQVKILGIRIEIGEIEAALRNLAAVQEVVIVAREIGQSEKSLFAYIVAADEQRPTASSLRQSLRKTIPDYMIPTAFVFLNALPLSPNGKIDRTQLPAVRDEIEEAVNAQSTSLTMMEELVLGVWSNVMKRKHIGRHQNFFDLGGHSLLVIQVISRLKAITGIELHVKDVFEQPTVAQLAGFLEQLMRTGERLTPPAIEPVARQEKLPLSFAQQRLWFIEQLEPGTSLYMIPLLLRLHGPVQVQVLERSLHLIVQRQQSLRTIFPSQQGVPQQVIVSQDTWQLPLIDLSDLDEPERQQKEQHLLRQAIHQPFNLEHGPLFRTLLLRVQPEEYVLVCSLHHMIADGLSLEILQREIALCYSALFAEEMPGWPPLPIQYADFAVWQREQLQGAALDQQLAYWSERLAGAPALLELPIDYPRPSMQTYQGAHVQHRLPASVTAALQAISQREHTTLFMSLLAAFAALLARSSSQEDLIIGTPIANRTRSEIEDLIGFFANTLPIRVDLRGAISFSQLLKQVRLRALEAYAHQDVPFERLVEHVQPERTLSHSPLVQVMMILQQEDGQPLTFSNMRVELLDVEIEVAKFDLTLTVRQQGDELWCNWEYNTQLFERESMVRLGQHFQVLLEGMLNQPEQAIGRLPQVTPTERAQLEEWNATTVNYPVEGCLHELFEAQVERTPDAIAVVLEEEQLSYAEVNRRANQLAHILRVRGVGPEVLVGICMERSIEMVVGLLAILKAGGAYVPLDPDYPQERLRFLLEDIQGKVVLTQERLRARLAHVPVPLICLDSEQVQWSDQPQSNPIAQVSPENVAYMIYTSGSTGKPKGVMSTHRGISNRLLWMQDAYRLTPEDRVLQKTPYTFDVSVWEFFWPLLAGACLVVAQPGIHRESASLIACIREQQITTLHFVPSMLSLFLQEHDVEQCQSIRQVLCSGEALLIEQQRRFFARLDAQLYNLYGPTEAAIDVTSWTCEREGEHATVPIGRPIDNIQIYILDKQGQPVPVGVAGELHIGGVGVARGYLHRPDLTAEKFVPHPFGRQEGARLYKTGDLACYQADGAIRYLGRIDHQIKLRGQRIELGEIEISLKQHPTVQDTVVIAREDQPGDKRLVAYVVIAEGAEINVTVLHTFLSTQLPQYMIPSAFMQLEHIPLSINGKLDRAALPVPAQWNRDEKAGEYIAPRTHLEETLAVIWSQVLDIERISIHDNFFVLGGDSIRSIQILSLMKERGLFCSLQQFFQSQTIHDFANILQSTQTESVARPTIEPFGLLTEEDKALLSAGIEDAYPLTALQAGMIYHLLLTADNPMYHNVISFHLRGTLHENALRQAFQLLIVRHANLRTSFDLGTYSKPLQLVHVTAPLPLEVVDLQKLPMDEQEQIITAFVQQEKTHLFDIASPPLLRLHVFRRTEETFQLTITEYHPILDGWSYHLNLAELFEYHEHISRGDVPEPAHLQSSFRDYVALEQQVLQSAEHRNYWLQKLSGSTFLQVPRLQAQGHNGDQPLMRSHEIPLSPQFSDDLWQLSRHTAFPVKSIMLAAHTRLMTMLAGSPDVVTGFVSNGRLEETDGDKVRGIFLLTIPFRLIAAPGTWIDFIRQVFQAEQDFLPFRRYPLSAIQEDLGGQTLLETAFNYMHFHSVADLFHKTIEIIEPPKTLEETHFTLQTNVWLEPASSRIYLNLMYDASAISEEQMVSISQYYENILRSMVSNPHAYHQHQSFFSPGETLKYLFGWNRGDTLSSTQSLAHTAFEIQAAQTPDALAVDYDEESLTYGELNRRANQLARYLQRQGVGPEILVGISVERSLHMLVGLLGILKAGGAYVPLDPNYPRERLALMLEDSQARLLLTEECLVASLPEHRTCMVCLDTDWPAIEQEREENPLSSVTGKNVAYVIYTSGSTGRPKGVQIPHEAVVNFLASMRQKPGIESQDVLLAVTSISFDIAALELFLPLTVGARVVIASHEEGFDGKWLAERLERTAATIMQATPATWLLLLGSGWPGNARLKILCGGEALRKETALQLEARSASLWNMYGPTETTIWSTLHQLCAKTSASCIGSPIANTELYILDQYWQPVPAGVPGALYIGGAGLARGYLNVPDLTAERFVPHPYSSEPGTRLYQTGDLACYQPDGTLEFLGRLDHQIKLRGFRIELSEIESALHRYPAVQNCVAVLREDTPGDRYLVAYMVLESEETFTVSAVRAFLRGCLPEYMLPAHFVVMEHLPLTPNGKIDRRVLPAPDQSRPQLEETYEPPQTTTEEILAMVWASALSIDQVGIHDNFFALGGDSIRSIQILAQARQRGLLFTLQQLFQHQTIFQLARMLVAEEQSYLPLDDAQPGSLLTLADWRNCPADVEDAYPLARLQAGMLFHSQYNADFALYQDIMTYHLQAPLNIEHLREVLHHLVKRHVILRTSFDLERFSEPLQLVHRSADIPLQVIDLCGYPQEDQETILANWIEGQKHQSFDCTHAPLLRLFIHIRSDHSFQFTLNCHHAILDGWSVASLLTELFTHYFTLLEGRVLSVENSLKTNYREFIAREQHLLQSKEAQRYWTQVLAGSTRLVLPQWVRADWKKESTTSHEFPVPLSLELSERLNHLARRLTVPVKNVLLAVHLKVLGLLSGQADILTGLVSNGRPETPDGERLLGLFLNTLPLRVMLQRETWVELIHHAFAAECELLPYRGYPLAEIQRQEGGRDLFTTLFTFTRFHVYNALVNVKNFQVISAEGIARTNFAFDVRFSQDTFSSQIRLTVACNLDKSSPEQVEMLASYYISALHALVDNPHALHTQQSLLSPTELQRTLVEWNATREEHPQETVVHLLIEDQAKRTPDAVAVVCENECLTYAQLNERANQLAQYLRDMGVGPEVAVGICMRRSVEMLIGLLGILKAGGAYVPLDPAYPQARLAFMLNDANVAVLITQSTSLSALPAHDRRIVSIDTAWPEIAQKRQDNLSVALTPDSLAYIIYTSGTTGRPKGAMITHGGLSNYLSWAATAYGVERGMGSAVHSSLSFDLTVTSLFTPLLVGRSVVMVEETSGVEGLAQAIRRYGSLSLLKLTPAHLLLLETILEPEDLACIEATLVIGGEALAAGNLENWQRLAPQARYINEYGPTETVVGCCVYEVPAPTGQSAHIPIGHPIKNTQLYVLDVNLQPVPIGVVGELYIAGTGVARGYLHRPEITAERFLPDPFSREPGKRMYRSGDRVRYRVDGILEYLGRVDHQVKVRGFRIELGEIEVCLEDHPMIDQAAVLVREDQPGEKTLAAYIQMATDADQLHLSQQVLHAFLGERLPTYMIPTHFVCLQTFPLTSNGKVDRQALPAPDRNGSGDSGDKVLPQTPVEKVLAGIWTELLGVKSIGVDDDFFMLGGHSLLGTQLVTRIHRAFQVDFPLATLFEVPILADQALFIEDLILTEIERIDNSTQEGV
ncbi:MAG: amino acid adenylation domain-containing protein [Ktedonobacteraceae bacterium]